MWNDGTTPVVDVHRRSNGIQNNQQYTVVISESVVLKLLCTNSIIICTRYVCCLVITYSKSNNQPGEVANPVRGQLNRENEFFPVPVRA